MCCEQRIFYFLFGGALTTFFRNYSFCLPIETLSHDETSKPQWGLVNNVTTMCCEYCYYWLLRLLRLLTTLRTIICNNYCNYCDKYLLWQLLTAAQYPNYWQLTTVITNFCNCLLLQKLLLLTTAITTLSINYCDNCTTKTTSATLKTADDCSVLEKLTTATTGYCESCDYYLRWLLTTMTSNYWDNYHFWLLRLLTTETTLTTLTTNFCNYRLLTTATTATTNYYDYWDY